MGCIKNGGFLPVQFLSRLSPYQGLSLAVLGAFLQAINACLVKTLTTMAAPAIALSREGILFAIILPIFIWSRLRFLSPKGTRIQLLMRSLCGCTSFMSYFFALSWMPIADVTVILSTTPVAVTLLARFCLKKDEEASGLVHWLSMGLSLLGLLILSRLPEVLFNPEVSQHQEHLQYWWGFAAAIIANLLGAAVIVFLRQLRHVSIVVVQMNHCCVAVIELLAINLTLSPWIPLSLPRCGFRDGPFLITIAVFSLGAQMSLTASLQTEQAGPVALVRFAGRVFFVFLFQIIFLNELPDAYSTSAAILIMISLVLSTFRRYQIIKTEKKGIKDSALEMQITTIPKIMVGTQI